MADNKSKFSFDLISQPDDPDNHDAASRKDLLKQRKLPEFLGDHQRAALRYKPSKELLQAINMALHTGSPLLLTGEPGTGKTQAADFIGAFFGIKVYKFLVKSTATAQDLMYEFDAVGYLHWAQAARNQPASEQAIQKETEAVRMGFLHKQALWQAYEEEGDAIVLIDEIDKAPRDFPNDLLHELDQHSFPHPFAQHEMIKPNSGRPPIVIVTSNEERRLPDAFLRRCIFHRIELTDELVEAAVESMAGKDGRGFPHLDEEIRRIARRRFLEIRNKAGLEKKPSTAELLTWLSILSAHNIDREKLKETLDKSSLKDLPGIGALIKDAGDLQRLG
jgi:MoxR-like ATPase